MLTIIQIIAILQGGFLGFTLFQRRKDYRQLIFWLFMGCIISVILFSIGDDDYNLIIADANWFFFHETLIATFLFFFIRYSNSGSNELAKIDVLFLLPYLFNVVCQSLLSIDRFADEILLESCVHLSELCLAGMLLYSIYDILSLEKERWLLIFIVPFTLIYIVDGIAYLFSSTDTPLLLLDSYGIFLIAIFLFYFVTYRLITAPKDMLSYVDHKYKSSTLSKKEVAAIKGQLNRLMTEEKLFKNQKLTVDETAKRIGISRQQLSEVLNVHMGMRFQEFLNQYRVEEFIKYLDQEQYQNFTLLGIATEVGFSSKSSFNSTFKKLKGITPSQYKKQRI